MPDDDDEELPAELIGGPEEGEKETGWIQKYDDDQTDKENGGADTQAPTGEQDPKLLPPVKRYAPKEKRIIIPFEIPWENRAARESQKGMFAFGMRQDPVPRINQGEKPLIQGSLHTETFLTQFAATNIFDNQSGTGGFGKIRNKVSICHDSKPLDPELIRASAGIIPMQAGSGAPKADSQATSRIGAMRLQVPRIKYQDNMTDACDAESSSFIHKFLAPNPDNRAGSSIIGRGRSQTEYAKCTGDLSPATQFAQHWGVPNDSILHIPLLWDTEILETPDGTGAGVAGLGAFRQITAANEVYGGPKRTVKMETASKNAFYWQTSGTIRGTSGMPPFGKHREIKPPIKPKLHK